MNINDKVICISNKPLSGNDIAPQLVEGQEYSIQEIHTCKCGKEHINVGLPMEVNYVRCYDCREELPTTSHWCHPSRFVKQPYEI